MKTFRLETQWLRVPRFPSLLPRQMNRRARGPQRFPFTSQRQYKHFLGRTGLWHAVDLLGLRPGDRVLMPAYNCGVEVEVLLRRGLRLDFYPIGMDLRPPPGTIEDACRPDTRAIYVIHYLGLPQPLREVDAVVAGRGIPMIEDCALALLSENEGRGVGSRGDVSIFSLTKFLPLPDGGLLVFNRPGIPAAPALTPPSTYGTFSRTVTLLGMGLELRNPTMGSLFRRAKQWAGRSVARPLGFQGSDLETVQPHTLDWGMSGLSRALLGRLDLQEILNRRRANFRLLGEYLQGCEDVVPLIRELPPGCCPLSFPILVEDNEGTTEALKAAGVGAAAMWREAHPAIPKRTFLEVESLRRQVVELPIHQDLEERHLDLMAHRVRQAAISMRQYGRNRSVERFLRVGVEA